MLDYILNISVFHFSVLSAAIFCIGLLGILLNRKNLILTLISIEVMLLSVILSLVAYSSFFQDLAGQIFSIFIIATAAAESAIGLAILVLYFRKIGDIEIIGTNKLHD